MKILIYYLILPFLYLISILPFPLLYAFSDFLYLVFYKVIKYRKNVVVENLRRSFPEKSPKEIEKLAEEFYKYLCDLVVETFKTLTYSKETAQNRFKFHQEKWLNDFYEKGKSVIIVLGHYGNWEWAGPGFNLSSPFQLYVIYRPLSNPYFEKLMSHMRTRLGTKITPVQNTLREMVANRKLITATAFIADQNPSPENAFWTDFLHQDTGVFTGPEKLSKKFDYPVIYVRIVRVKRGYYEGFPELISDKPNETAENEITLRFTRKLERDIIKDHSIWLWSHKRWKYSRPIGK